jgi:hypothetical protein
LKGVEEHSSTTGPLRTKAFGAALCFLVSVCLCTPTAPGRQRVVEAPATRQARPLLGVSLSAEVSSWLDEVERRLGKEVYAEFAELDAADAGGDYTLGASYLTRAGVGVVRVDESLRARGDKLTEAVIGHELLHLRLRARGYPLFLFSPEVKTRKGPAQEVEQEHVNDLVSLIEHRVFALEMRRAGFDRLIDLTSWLETARRRGRDEDGQAEMLNYARAELEWNDPRLVEELTKIYLAHGWTRSLEGGRRLAGIIRSSNVGTPAEVTDAFLRCMSVLYSAQFRVEADRQFPLSRIYPQLLIHVQGPRPSACTPRGR